MYVNITSIRYSVNFFYDSFLINLPFSPPLFPVQANSPVIDQGDLKRTQESERSGFECRLMPDFRHLVNKQYK